jgi:hypothetical protein
LVREAQESLESQTETQVALHLSELTVPQRAALEVETLALLDLRLVVLLQVAT